MVEFALVTMVLLVVTFGGFEFDRMLMAYTSLANAARVGVRYAIVHGSTRTATGDAASGATDTSNVVTAVRSYAKLGFLTANNVTVTVDYPASSDPTVDPGNAPGSTVIVSVSSAYDPLTWLPLRPTLKSTSRGVIVF